MTTFYPSLPTLSVKQPWASLILAGVKRFEVRSWPLRETGLLLLHSSSTKAPGMPARRTERLYESAIRAAKMTDEPDWVQSAIVGVITVVRIWEPHERRPRMSRLERYLGRGPDDFLWEVGRTWRFRTPIPVNGKLNIWEPDGAVRRRVINELGRRLIPAARYVGFE